MADTPTPRSYNQILGEMYDAFVSKTGISALKVGSPLRSLMEAVAQSQLKNSEDIFTLLNSISLEYATGTALDALAADEGIARRNATSSFGYVTFTDTSFTKVQTVMQTEAAIGSSTISVRNCIGFKVNDYVTINLNGDDEEVRQISAIDLVNKTLTFTTVLQYPHPPNTPILKRQGGQRTIPPLTNIGNTVLFNTINQAVLPDGETVIENVPVVCSAVGTSGNVGALSLNQINSSLPFTATVTNPLPFTNAIDEENDDSLRQRIRLARQVKQKATGLAIQQSVLGISAPDEQKNVVSVSLVDVGEGKASLYIDDGTGYEGRTTTVSFESLTDSASGGEQYFELQGGRPVSKAFVLSANNEPFIIDVATDVLEVRVGSKLYTHTFKATDFVSPAKANAYEIVSSINEKSELGFYATTADNRSKVKLLPKAETDDTIQVVSQGTAFNFPSTPMSTMYLFKNNVLLTKDGREAFIDSYSKSGWIGVDPNTASLTFQYYLDTASAPLSATITNELFDILTGGQFSSIASANGSGQQELDAWTKVLNYVMVGAHCTNDGSRITVVSNLGKDSDARIGFPSSQGTLPSELLFYGVFPKETAVGKTGDYTLNRNKGQIFLTEALADGDSLIAGSVDIRAPLISTGPISSPPYPAPSQLQALWFLIDDAQGEVVTTSTPAGSSIDVSYSSGTPNIVRLTGVVGAFSNVKVTDWAIVYDPALFVGQLFTSWTKRVHTVASDGSYIELIEDSSIGDRILSGPKTLTEGGITVVRSTEIPQRVSFDAYNSVSELEALINAQLTGAHCKVLSNKLALYSNSYAPTGSVTFLGATASLNSGLYSGWNHTPVTNPADYQQSLVSDSDTNVPDFANFVANDFPSSYSNLLGKLNVFTFAADGSLSDAAGYRNLYSSTTTYDATLNSVGSGPTPYYTTSDYKSIYSGFHFGNADTLEVVLDGDATNNSYSILMKVPAYIDSFNALTLVSGVSPSVYFDGANLKDWAIWRYASSTLLSYTDTTPGGSVALKSLLIGPNNPVKRVRYTYPTVPDADFVVETQTETQTSSALLSEGVVSIVLPSGSETTCNIKANNSNQKVYAKVDPALNKFSIYSYIQGIALTTGAPGSKPNKIIVYKSTVPAPPPIIEPFPYFRPCLANGFLADPMVSLNWHVKIDGISDDFTVVILEDEQTDPSTSDPCFIITLNQDIAALNNGDMVWFAVGQNTITLNGDFDGSSPQIPVYEDFLMNVNFAPQTSYTDGLGLRSGSYRVDNVDTLTSGTYYKIDVIAEKGTHEDGNFFASQMRFFPLAASANDPNQGANLSRSIVKTENLPNDYFTVTSDSDNPVLRSTEELHNFNTAAIVADGVFTDSSNYIANSDSVYTITTKATTTFDGSEVALVPVTAQNVTDNIVAFFGSINASASASSHDGNKVEIVRTQTGSDKTIEVVSGTATQSLKIPVLDIKNVYVDYPTTINTVPVVTIAAQNADVLSVQHPVKVQANSNTVLINDQTNNCTFNALTNQITTTATNALWELWGEGFSIPASDPYVAESLRWSVKRIGNFAQYKLTNAAPTGFSDLFNLISASGGWVKIQNPALRVGLIAGNDVTVYNFDRAFNSLAVNDVLISSSASPLLATKTITSISTGSDVIGLDSVSGITVGSTLSCISNEVTAASQGVFRIVGVDTTNFIFWVENPNAVDGTSFLTTRFVAPYSIVPAKSTGEATCLFSIQAGSSQYLGEVSNLKWTLADLAPASYASSTRSFYSKSSPGFSSLTGTSSKFTFNEPYYTYSIIDNIVTDTNATLRNVSLASFVLLDQYMIFGQNPVLIPQNKLNFPLNDAAKNADAYKYYNGLIGESNKIIYGDAQNPIQYPGYASANANIEVLPPQVKRIQVAITVRMNGGYSVVDSRNAIRSAAATAIINTPVGKDVAFSDIVAAVNAVPGVFAAYVTNLTASPTSPVYSATNTTINVTANEKALVINPEQDIQVTFVGVP